MSRRAWLCAFTALASAVSVAIAQNTTSSPTVALNGNATVVGVTTFTGLDTFLGIPFAQPPVGRLRFAAPAPVVYGPSTVINATAYGPSCIQPPSDVRDILIYSIIYLLDLITTFIPGSNHEHVRRLSVN